MPRRTDAAARTLVFVVVGLTGCTAAQRVAVPRPAVQAPNPLPQLAGATTLAMPLSPVGAQRDVKPAGHSSDDEPRRLYLEATAAYSSHPSYIARLRRREVAANGTMKPDEIIMVRFREQPWSVHFKWLGDEGKGREIVYVNGQHENKLHVLTAAGDIPLMGGGRRMSFPLDSPLVKSSSRYPITASGVGRIIERYGKFLDLAARPGSGASVKFLGATLRPEYPVPLEGVELTLPPNYAPEVPQGGKRQYYFDPATKFPVVSITMDPNGTEVDYVCFDRFQLDVKLDDADFDPNRLWPVKK